MTVRYALVLPEAWGTDGERRPESTVPLGAVLFDAGGPGISVLNGDFNLSAVRHEVWDGANGALIALEEPWVTSSVPDDCLATSTTYYRALRDAGVQAVSEAAGALPGTCDAWFGFTPELYSRTVLQILSDNDLTLAGFVGHSFASVRYAYLVSWGVEVPWAIVTRPFPYGVAGSEIVQVRSEVVAQDAAAQELSRRAGTSSAEGRSVETVPFDYWSAAIELGYLTKDKRESALAGLTGADEAAFVGGLSDELWGRYAVDSVSPGMFAQWQEVCGVTGEVSPLLQEPSGGVPFALWSQLAMCPGVEPSLPPPSTGLSAGGWQQTWELAQHKLCVTASSTDSVTPGSLIHKYLGHAKVIDVTDASHADVEGFDACQEYLKSLDPVPGVYGPLLGPEGP